MPGKGDYAKGGKGYGQNTARGSAKGGVLGKQRRPPSQDPLARNQEAAKGSPPEPRVSDRPQNPPPKKDEEEAKEEALEGSTQGPLSEGGSHQTEAFTEISWPEAFGPMPIDSFYIKDGQVR